MLESMVSSLTESGTRKPRISIEPVEDFSFDKYFVKIEEILAQFETMIHTRILEQGHELFSSLIAEMDPLSSARCFLAMLYLAMKGTIHIEQTNDSADIILSQVRDGPK